MTEPKRQLSSLVLVSALVATAYLATDLLGPKKRPAPLSRTKTSQIKEADVPQARNSAPPKFVSFVGEQFAARASSAGGLVSLKLMGEQFRDNKGNPLELVSTEKNEYLPLRVDIAGTELDEQWRIEPVTSKVNGRNVNQGVRMLTVGKDLKVERLIEAGKGPYQLWSTIRIENTGKTAHSMRMALGTYHYVRRRDEDSGFFGARSPAIGQGVCLAGSETIRKDREKLLKLHGYGPRVSFSGIENAYFANVLAADAPKAERCELRSSNRGGSIDKPEGTLFASKLIYPKVTLEPGKAVTYRTLAYIGPKLSAPLQTAGHDLHKVVDLGFFSILAQYFGRLLHWTYGGVHNWGLAIILLTVLVKLILYPLTEKSFQSMARMRVLKPEMDRINELYADDRERKGAAMMELYRRHKINPLGGCLPSLLQLPVWFALYASLSTNVELYHAKFALWWTDLSAPDPFFVLPLLLGGLMYVQQKITPSTMDPAQAKMMLYFMPVMMTSFMLFLPAGLCLYMVTNSSLGIAQQQLIQYRLDHQKPNQGENGADASGTTTDNAGSKPDDNKSQLLQRRPRRGRA